MGSGLQCKESNSVGQHRLKVCCNGLKEDFIKFLCLRSGSDSEPLRETHGAVWVSGAT